MFDAFVYYVISNTFMHCLACFCPANIQLTSLLSQI